MGEINGIHDVGYTHDQPIERTLDLADPELVRIIRIRYIGDAWSQPLDHSYTHGETASGERVWVGGLPYQVRSGRTLKRELYEAATEVGVNLNRLCGGHLTDVLSVLW